MKLDGLTKFFFIFILIIITWEFFKIISPYFSTILWAAILTVVFYPLKKRFKKMLFGRNRLASLLTTSIICLIVFIPLIVIFSSLAIELNVVYTKLQCNNTHFSEIITKLFRYLPDWIKTSFAEHYLNNTIQLQKKLSEIALKSGKYLAGSVFLIGKGTFDFTIKFCVMLYLLFFLLKDGIYLIRWILNLLPLTYFEKHHLFDKFVIVTRTTIKGTVLIAVIQGLLGSIAFYITDVEGSILYGTMTAFLSLLPVIGSAIIWIPAAIYFFAIQQIWKCFFIIFFF